MLGFKTGGGLGEGGVCPCRLDVGRVDVVLAPVSVLVGDKEFLVRVDVAGGVEGEGSGCF